MIFKAINKRRNYGRKIEMKFGGYIYVESYRGKHNEEDFRSKIYDENKNYLNYIDTEFLSKKEYHNILKEYRNQQLEEFISNFADSYDYSVNLECLLASAYDEYYIGYDEYNYCKEFIDELTKDCETLTEKELCDKYDVNRIGDYFIKMSS